MRLSSLQTRLLAWYHKNKRTLPWRGHPNPYAVWVSEIMLQQTRVETVIPYFERWMRLFPTVQALADASEQEALNAWEGLGYYRRARSLHQAAQVIVRDFGGRLPQRMGELMKLPGVGRYTAGAIASIAFGADEPALDGNLKRIYARLFDVTEPVDSPKGEKLLWEIARQNLPEGRAGDFNQALMDLGAALCLPKNPRCWLCPLMDLCRARQNGTQELRPLKKPKKPVPHHVHAAGVILRRGKVLLAQRPARGLLGGMWEFPNGRVEADAAGELAQVLEAGYRLKVQRKEALGVVQHAYTHFKVTVYVFQCNLLAMSAASSVLRWVAVGKLEEYPMGKIDRWIARALL